MDIKPKNINDYKEEELAMVKQLEALNEIIDRVAISSAEDVGIACRSSSTVIRMYSTWAETGLLIKCMRDLRERITEQLKTFYKTCISSRGTTIGMALDFAKFNTEDICGDKKKGNKATTSKCSK